MILRCARRPTAASCRFVHLTGNRPAHLVSYDHAVRRSFAVVSVLVATLVCSTAGATSALAAPIDGAGSATASATRLGNQEAIKPLPPPPTARYRVTIVSEWTAASHPVTRPGNSHFSPTVLANHGVAGDLFVVGVPASPGIEQMAETGATGTLRAELAGDGSVSDVLTGSSIFGVGQNSFDVTAGRGDDLISLVTMLAPSPDWFVGIHDVDLLRSDGWIDRLELDLGNYDAGTDSGPGFTSANADTNPAQVISGPRDAAFAQAAAENRFGRVVIERLS